MTKWDLIHVALKELKKQWNSGENRDFFDTLIESPNVIGSRPEIIIKWEPKLAADSQNQMNIPKAVRIAKKNGGLFVCTIIDTASTLPHHSRNGKDKIIQEEHPWHWFTRLNRDFENLRADIEGYKRLKENSLFLNRFSSSLSGLSTLRQLSRDMRL